MDYYVPLLADEYYHIVSRSIGSEKLFWEAENYRFFLQRYQKHISPIADTFSYCLLPNHFHFLIRIKSYEELLGLYLSESELHKEQEGWQSKFIMQQFSNLLNSYTKSLNKRRHRKVALFMNYLRRVHITNDAQYTATSFYIHKDPVHHRYCSLLKDWPCSPYSAILSSAPTMVIRNEVLDWFGDIAQFETFHNQPVYKNNASSIE